MAATKGNRFWELRGKHGRDRIIEDHVKLFEDATEYFNWCDENPIYITEIVNSKMGIQLVEKPMRRPYQKDALALSVGLSEWRLIKDLKKVSEDFSQTVTRIERIIYTQKFEGASVGQFNPNIIARDLQLTENIDHKSGGEKIKFNIGFTDETDND